MKKIHLVAVESDHGVYISRNESGSKYVTHDTVIESLTFGGEKAARTFRNDWYLVKTLDCDVLMGSTKKDNERYELKRFVPASVDLPPIVLPVPLYPHPFEEYEDSTFPPEMISREELYEYLFDYVTAYEPVELEVTVLAKMDGFEIVKVEHNLKHRLIDEITTHPVLLTTKPCELSSEESYSIIRNYIKQNIDPKVAKISADYDFCMTVEKVIELSEPEPYMVDVNNLVFNARMRKPKIETRYRNARSVVSFKAAPNRSKNGVYDGYSECKKFSGGSYEDMLVNMKKYLEDLISDINRPLVDCPCCKGAGVIDKESK